MLSFNVCVTGCANKDSLPLESASASSLFDLAFAIPIALAANSARNFSLAAFSSGVSFANSSSLFFKSAICSANGEFGSTFPEMFATRSVAFFPLESSPYFSYVLSLVNISSIFAGSYEPSLKISANLGYNEPNPSGNTNHETPSKAPKKVPGNPCPVKVFESNDKPTIGTVAAETIGGILFVISSYFFMSSSASNPSAAARTFTEERCCCPRLGTKNLFDRNLDPETEAWCFAETSFAEYVLVIIIIADIKIR